MRAPEQPKGCRLMPAGTTARGAALPVRGHYPCGGNYSSSSSIGRSLTVAFTVIILMLSTSVTS